MSQKQLVHYIVDTVSCEGDVRDGEVRDGAHIGERRARRFILQ